MSKNTILDDEKDILLDHEYDGIQELDNPLPGWWLMTFYLAIVYSVFYVGYYEFGAGPTLSEELETSMAGINAKKELMAQGKGEQPIADLATLLKDKKLMATGEKVFLEKCAACHAADGGGVIGPNLTDKFWIMKDDKLATIMSVVDKGILDKGMPPWGPVLKEDELLGVSVFVKSLEGKTPANPKAPQGNPI